MRGLRSVIALIVVLAGLYAYIYFVTSKKPEGDTGPKQDKVFTSVQADKIDDLRIKSESGDTTALKKSDAGWQLVEPTAGADESQITGITSALTQLEIVRVVDENPAGLKEYGLDVPRIQVDFTSPGDKDSHRLIIGDKSPTGADLFATRDAEKRVFLIGAFQEQTFNRSTFDLRDKTLLKFDRDKVDSFEVSAGGKSLEIAKEGGDWKITKPLKASADTGSVEGLVGRVQTARMKTFVANDASAADLKKYGLDKPGITLQVNAGSAKATLLVGGKADDTSVYARDASKPAVMTMDSTLADDLRKNADEYRRKEVFAFRAFTANRIDITRNGQTVAFEKAKADGKDAATVRAPATSTTRRSPPSWRSSKA
jgi:hypothetical protein